MLRHVISPARFFAQIPNQIIRHPRLSSHEAGNRPPRARDRRAPALRAGAGRRGGHTRGCRSAAALVRPYRQPSGHPRPYGPPLGASCGALAGHRAAARPDPADAHARSRRCPLAPRRPPLAPGARTARHPAARSHRPAARAARRPYARVRGYTPPSPPLHAATRLRGDAVPRLPRGRQAPRCCATAPDAHRLRLRTVPRGPPRPAPSLPGRMNMHAVHCAPEAAVRRLASSVLTTQPVTPRLCTRSAAARTAGARQCVPPGQRHT